MKLTTLMTGSLALALSLALPARTSAQVSQQQPATGATQPATQVPSGSATGTTDRAGQTNQPAGTSGTKQPPTGNVIPDQPAPNNPPPVTNRNQSQSPNRSNAQDPNDPSPRGARRELPNTASPLPVVLLVMLGAFAGAGAMRAYRLIASRQ